MKKFLTFLSVAFLAFCCTLQADAQTRRSSTTKKSTRTQATATQQKPFKGTFEYDDPRGNFAITMVIDLYNKTVDGDATGEKCYGTIEYASARGVYNYDITEVSDINHNGASVHIVGGPMEMIDDENFTIQEAQNVKNKLTINVSQLLGTDNYKPINLKRTK